MTQFGVTKEKQQYNAATIRTAQALDELRRRSAKTAEDVDNPLAELFPPHSLAGLGITLEYERMNNRPVSADLQEQANQYGFELEHLALTIGTVIHGIDLKPTRPVEITQFIRALLLQRKVIFFCNQHLSEDEQVDFSREFGDLDAFPFGPPGENPFILQIRHDNKNPGRENVWHTDVTWMEQPSLGSIAQCVEVPPYGGDTLFSDSHAAYLGLRTELQQRIEFLHGINDYQVFINRHNIEGNEDLVAQIKAEIPFGVSHPLVRTHPETGKQALYLHGGFLRHDSLYDSRTGEKVETSESRAIVRELLAQHSRPEYICRFKWTQGAMAFWDNRAVQHYAVSDYHPHRRVLRRVTVSGDKPFYNPEA